MVTRCIAWALAALVCGAPGCTRFGNAFDERIAQNLSGRFRRVTLECDLPAEVHQPLRLTLPLARVLGPGDQRALLTPFAVVPGSASGEFVGEVFGQGTGRTRWSSPFPLGVEGPPLAEQLATALRALLAPAGVALAEGGPSELPGLVLTLKRVWVQSYSGGFFELRGHLVADVEWSADLLAPGGSTLWSHTFAHHAERRITYAYADDHEALLREVWCGSLFDFSAVADAELVPLLTFAP